jgi:hypothetical protein
MRSFLITLSLSLGAILAGAALAIPIKTPVLLGAAGIIALLALAGILARPRATRPLGRPLVVDGSNVMHWKDEAPQIATLREVIALLQQRGYAPGLVFDANAGYKLTGRYMDDAPLARALGLPEDRVLVVPKGSPADPVILTAARDLGAPVLTNDRFRDWVETYPEVTRPGHLLRGGYRNGALWLEEPA